MKKWQLTLLVLVLIGASGYWFANVPATATPNGSQSIALYLPGPYKVSNETFTAIDGSRPTPAYKDFAGLPERVLKGKIWRPSGLQQPAPLVIYSHGFMSFREEGTYLFQFLASHGYTVVAANYPLTGFSAPEGPLMNDVVNQPGDISFLLDTILKRNADPADPMHNTIDPRKIAVAGVSLGGLTTTLAAFHHQLRGPRIGATISTAGPASIFTAEFFLGSTLPFLMIYGDGDAIVPYEENALPGLHKYPGSILVTLKNASHAGFAQPASTIMRFIDNPDGIGCRAVKKELGADLDLQNKEFTALLDATEDGIDLNASIEFCNAPPIPVAMQAARQHMFTTLASYAFLQSVFATDSSERDTARDYLLETLPQENASEVSVTR